MWSTIEKEINYIKSFLFNFNFKIILLVPQMEFNKIPEISDEVFINCLCNIRNRQSTHLLPYEGLNTYEILKQFQNNYKHFNKDSFDVDGII